MGEMARDNEEVDELRIGLIADIHGNVVALEAVLTELAREPVDRLICLGDVAAIGPHPREVIARLRTLGCPVTMGNTDAWLFAPPTLAGASERVRLMLDITHWNAQQLSTDDLAYVRAFPLTVEIALDDGGLLLCYHGSPRSFDDVLAATTPDQEVARLLAGVQATVLVGGHTHIQMVRRYEDVHLINVGSVGLPGVTEGSPELPRPPAEVRWAEYGILHVGGGHLGIDLRRTALDIAAVRQAARDTGMPHADWWLRRWARV